MKKWDLYWCDFGTGIGSEQGGKRPVLIIQNNVGNEHSPTTIVAPITSKFTKAKLPTHVAINSEYDIKGLILFEQIRVVDKSRIGLYIGEVNDMATILKCNQALKVSLGLGGGE